MDYDYILNKVYAKAEYFIIKQFKEFKNDDRPFPHAVDKIRIKLTKIYGENLVGRNFNLFESCYRIFNFRNGYYSDTSSITKVVENEIRKEFGEVIKINKPFDKNFNVIDNCSFNQFIFDLIIYDSLRRIEARLGENSDLYKLYYDTKEYGSFTLEAFDGHVINSKIYQDLYSKGYPNKKLPVAIGTVNQYGNKEWKIIKDDNPIEIAEADIQNESKIKKQDFDIDEQLLILNLCLVDNNAIPLTEKIKLLTLIGELKDKSIFIEQSSKNTAYSKVNKGILRKGSVSTMILIIDNIQIKIEKYILPLTQQTLKKHRSTLISEQKKQKHT